MKDNIHKPFLDILNEDYEEQMSKCNFGALKKGDRIKSNQLGTPITGKLMESPKQGKGLKKVILIWSNGSEIGMFDEHGSVYSDQIVSVERDGTWLEVSHS